MKERFFFIIRFLPKQADYGLLAGRCISQMHGFSINNSLIKNKIGVSFPKWVTESVGDSIAFVAENKDILVGLSFQPYFSLMVNEGLFDISSVNEVPESLEEVRFVRNQAIGKSFIGSKKRRIKRSIKRSEIKEYKASSKEEREFEVFNRIPISSGSSGEDFILHLQKEGAKEQESFLFNSYGFATNEEKRGSVPDLSFTNVF